MIKYEPVRKCAAMWITHHTPSCLDMWQGYGMPLIARFMGPTWGPSGADRTQVGPMLAPWTLLSGAVTYTGRVERRSDSQGNNIWCERKQRNHLGKKNLLNWNSVKFLFSQFSQIDIKETFDKLFSNIISWTIKLFWQINSNEYLAKTFYLCIMLENTNLGVP